VREEWEKEPVIPSGRKREVVGPQRRSPRRPAVKFSFGPVGVAIIG